MEVDAKDAKFNETFAECRERKGKRTSGHNIELDLTNEKETNDNEQLPDENSSDDDKDEQQYERPKRNTRAVQFLLPGTHAKQQLKTDISRKEIEIRKEQHTNLCMESTMEDAEVIFVMNCMESQIDEETKLMKELELLTACIYNEDNNEILLATIKNENEINLTIPDPKSQRDIDNMDPKDAERFNKATINEVKGMKHKQVIEYATMDDLPRGTKIYQSIVNWTSKTNLGVYIKTKCRICFGGHRYDKSYSDTFAPTVNFCTVLMMICFSAMFGWYMGSLDYSQAYLNANIDELCVMRAPIYVREFDEKGREFLWIMKKAIYGHPKASRLWAECLHRKLVELGYKQQTNF